MLKKHYNKGDIYVVVDAGTPRFTSSRGGANRLISLVNGKYVADAFDILIEKRGIGSARYEYEFDCIFQHIPMIVDAAKQEMVDGNTGDYDKDLHIEIEGKRTGRRYL